MLVNPTGKIGKFRAVDWVVELANLNIKVIECLVHTSSRSSHTDKSYRSRLVEEDPITLSSG